MLALDLILNISELNTNPNKMELYREKSIYNPVAFVYNRSTIYNQDQELNTTENVIKF